MTTQYTPAPWTLQQLETNHNGYDWPTFAIRSHPQNCCLAVVGDVDRYHADQNEANARLIATAPELLEVLKATIPALIRLGDFVGNIDTGGASGIGRIDRCALIAKVQAAIAKAEGKNIR